MIKEYSMTSIAPTISKLLGIRTPSQSVGEIIFELADDMQHQERLAAVVFDAFGVATWKRYEKLTPNFNLIAQNNLLHIRSVLPAKTPVNFATMVTGAPSDVHKIRDRAETLNIETVFNTISEASNKSAAIGRANSTVGILLSKFADYSDVATSDLDDEVLQIAAKVLEEKEPNFILMQLLDVDDAGHGFGLESDRFRTAISDIDSHLGKLFPYLFKGGYGLMVLADHGAHQSGGKAIHDGSVEDDMIVPLAWCNSDYLRKHVL